MNAAAPDPHAAPQTRAHAAVWDLLATVKDPEIPILSILELGIVRYVRDEAGALHVGLTPTYSGCPASDVIRKSVERTLLRGGIGGAVIDSVLSPAWTSDWITPAGHRKLADYGIAPPAQTLASPRHLFALPDVACPRCSSHATERVSEFGSTPCKAHYRCTACREPFDYFKCI